MRISFGIGSTPINRFLVNIASSNSVDGRFNNPQFEKIQDIKSVSQLLDITSHGFKIWKP